MTAQQDKEQQKRQMIVSAIANKDTKMLKLIADEKAGKVRIAYNFMDEYIYGMTDWEDNEIPELVYAPGYKSPLVPIVLRREWNKELYRYIKTFTMAEISAVQELYQNKAVYYPSFIEWVESNPKNQELLDECKQESFAYTINEFSDALHSIIICPSNIEYLTE